MAGKSIIWHILTGEFPPRKGGVADYTQLLAAKLSEAGDEVHVWTPAEGAPRPASSLAFTVHELPGNFGPAALRTLTAALKAETRPHRLLVQYVPHMYGFKGMNVFLARWLRKSSPTRSWVMFHEVAFPSVSRPWRHRFLSFVQRRMARWIAESMERGFVSVPCWLPLLDELAPGHAPCEWLPVPSNVATHVDPAAVRALRETLFQGTVRFVAAHFGTYSSEIRKQLEPAFTLLLRQNPEWGALLIGRGSRACAVSIAKKIPECAERIVAAEGLDSAGVAAHLSAADALYQPYPDGVSSRRGSTMAGLALGMPIATNSGASTEPVWHDAELVRFVETQDEAAVCRALHEIAADPARTDALRKRARDYYAAHFSADVLAAKLRAAK